MTDYILTQQELKAKLHYEPSTGIFTWIVSNKGIVYGSVAGHLNNLGYISLRLNRKLYQAHRLAFLYMNGSFPELQVDHINRIRNDNRWCNLRQATDQQNKFNIGIHSNNKSGYKGVHWREDRNKFEAQARVNNKNTRIGYFNTAIEASNAYHEFIKKYHGEFYSNK